MPRSIDIVTMHEYNILCITMCCYIELKINLIKVQIQDMYLKIKCVISKLWKVLYVKSYKLYTLYTTKISFMQILI